MQGDATEAQLRALFAEVQTLKQKAYDLREKSTEARFENGLEMRKILTPEQRKEFRGFMKEEGGKHKKGRWHKKRQRERFESEEN